MNRRGFLQLTASTGVLIALAPEVQAADSCVPSLGYISAEATYFKAYEHYHLLSIPVSALITLSDKGYTTRTSVLDQGSLDEEALKKFLKETGLSSSLKDHSHEVHVTQAELQRIANGEKDVEITVLTPKGNLAHRFYFTATQSALAKVRKARA